MEMLVLPHVMYHIVQGSSLTISSTHPSFPCFRADLKVLRTISFAMQLVDLEEVILPGNARLLYHDNECYDWGTLGWIMSAGIVDVDDYKHFIMINSSVRGPYTPPYQPVWALVHPFGALSEACCSPVGMWDDPFTFKAAGVHMKTVDCHLL